MLEPNIELSARSSVSFQGVSSSTILGRTPPTTISPSSKTVKQGRGISSPDLSKSGTKQDFINLIVDDARREFIGEGQTFFLYKRLKRNLEGSDEKQSVEYPAIEDNLVMPLPDSESNI